MNFRALTILFLLSPLCCSPDDGEGGGTGGGGAVGTGGAVGAGGAGSGGVAQTGGANSGGALASGGSATGGAQSGGTVGTGGDDTAAGGASSGGSVSGAGGGDGGGPTTGGATGDGGTASGTGGSTTSSGGATGACTPNPAGTSVDQGDGTFLDERTCLMWMKEPFPNSGDFIGRDHVADCVNAQTAGYNDWRGPDAAEMVSLLRLDGADCGMWNSPNLWDPELNTTGLNEPVMFYTATEGDGNGSMHQCAIDGNTVALNGGTRKNPWHVVCVRGTSPVTGTIASCTGTGCDY